MEDPRTNEQTTEKPEEQANDGTTPEPKNGGAGPDGNPENSYSDKETDATTANDAKDTSEPKSNSDEAMPDSNESKDASKQSESAPKKGSGNKERHDLAPESSTDKKYKPFWKKIAEIAKKAARGIVLIATFPVWGPFAGIRKLWNIMMSRHDRPPIKVDIDQMTKVFEDTAKEKSQKDRVTEPTHDNAAPHDKTTKPHETGKEQEAKEKPADRQPAASDNAEEINNALKEMFKKAYKEPQMCPLPDGSMLKFEANASQKDDMKAIKVTIVAEGKEPILVYEKRQEGSNVTRSGDYNDVKKLLLMSMELTQEKSAKQQTTVEHDPDKCAKIVEDAINSAKSTGRTEILNIADGNKLEITPSKDGGYGIFLRYPDNEISELYAYDADELNNRMITHGSIDAVIKAIYPGIVTQAPVLDEPNMEPSGQEQNPAEETAPVDASQEPDLTTETVPINIYQESNPVENAYKKAQDGHLAKVTLENGEIMTFKPTVILDSGKPNIDVYIEDHDEMPADYLIKNEITTDDFGNYNAASVTGSIDDVMNYYRSASSLDKLIESCSSDKDKKEEAYEVSDLQEER